jgi:hypothetical protein
MSAVNNAGTRLASWNDTPTTQAIVEFVDRVTREGDATYIPPAERVAVFDNDGTLWCEKPMPIELGFILKRLAEMADTDTSLRDRQPWKAAHERDHAWLGDAITKHYHGDDTDVKLLMGGILRAFGGMTVDDYAAAAHEFLRGRHPTMDRSFRECGYLPMINLLRYLEANSFSTFIASGGDRDFMRPVTEEIYGVPAERVIGSSNALSYQEDEHGGTLVYLAQPDVFDDGPTKPVRIWSRIGRRPLVAGGNSNGDIPMLRYAGGASRPRSALAGAPRRSRTRVRIHRGRRDVARPGERGRLDRSQHQARLGNRVRRLLVTDTTRRPGRSSLKPATPHRDDRFRPDPAASVDRGGSWRPLLFFQHEHLASGAVSPAMRGKRDSMMGRRTFARYTPTPVSRSALSASADDRAEIPVGQEEQVPQAMVMGHRPFHACCRLHPHDM